MNTIIFDKSEPIHKEGEIDDDDKRFPLIEVGKDGRYYLEVKTRNHSGDFTILSVPLDAWSADRLLNQLARIKSGNFER